MPRPVIGSFRHWLPIVIALAATPLAAQDLIVQDDAYGIPYGEVLLVEPVGVLENDTVDGEPASEMGGVAELVTDALYGLLSLAPDGGFTYDPGPGFEGLDSFVYRTVVGTVSAEATVLLSACEGGPDVFTCWKEAAFLAKAAELGLAGFSEGFEDDLAWGAARSPYTSPAVVSQGVRWTSNHTYDPAFNEISSGPGPARTGQWAIFDLDHGYATGNEVTCDVDDPPGHCLYHDGWTGTREPGLPPLHGVGGWITGTWGAKVGIRLDDAPPIGTEWVGGGHRFIGAIDARPAGFSRFSFREQDGKIGNAFYVFGDDFTMLVEASTDVSGDAPGETRARFAGAGPNPSNGNTTLRFTLDGHADVRLVVFDQRGRLVRELTAGTRGAGPHALSWDGRDMGGRSVAAGTYFGRLTVERDGQREVEVRKLAVTR